jgi:hypothetical protein
VTRSGDALRLIYAAAVLPAAEAVYEGTLADFPFETEVTIWGLRALAAVMGWASRFPIGTVWNRSAAGGNMPSINWHSATAKRNGTPNIGSASAAWKKSIDLNAEIHEGC